MKNKLKEVLSEIKYPVFEGMKPEVSFKNQFSDDAFEYIVRDMIARGITVEDIKVIHATEKQLEGLVDKAFMSGACYGIALLLKSQGEFDRVDTMTLAKELLKDVK